MVCGFCGISITRCNSLKKTSGIITLAILFSIGCIGLIPVSQLSPTSTPLPSCTFRPLPSPTETVTPVPTSTITETVTASLVPTITPTETLTFTPEPQFSVQGPGNLLVPILLYHQI